MRRWVWATWLLWVASVAAEPAVSPSRQGEVLRQRLEGGTAVTVLLLGDSIGSGMHLDAPQTDGFLAVFGRMLRERYPQAQVNLLNWCQPGAPSRHGLDLMESRVPSAAPNLILFQYGGNDKGVDDGLDTLPQYELNLKQLVAASHRLQVPCMLLTPPMREPVPNLPYPLTCRRVGQTLAIPVADLDTVLKAAEHDYRGFFPYWVHPQEHDHARIAAEVYRAFTDLIDRPLSLHVELPPLVSDLATPGTPLNLPVLVRSDGPALATVTVTSPDVACGPAIRVAPGGRAEAPVTLWLPHTLSGGRSEEWPLWLSADDGRQKAFAQARVTMQPEINVPRRGNPAAEVPIVRLSQAHLTAGRGSWAGPQDLSAALRLAVDEQTLTVRVDVTDDVLTFGGAPQNDGLELYFDLRSDAERGKPYYSRQVFLLFLHPSKDGRPLKVTTATEDQVDPALLDLTPAWRRTVDGYRFVFDVPRPLLDRIAGRRVAALGFDLAVDDADHDERKSQLMWLGRPNNFVNPRRFGELRLDQPAPPGAVRVTVF